MAVMRLVVLLATFVGTLANDRTLEKGAWGTDVVISSVNKVQQSCIFSNDFQFMRRIAWLESQDGTLIHNKTVPPNGGLWQVDAASLKTVQNALSQTTQSQQISDTFNISVETLNWNAGDLQVPIDAAIVGRAKVAGFSTSIPMTISDQANLWAQNYATNKTVQDFIEGIKSIPPCASQGMDLMFIVDSSGSIGDAFPQARDFVKTVVEGLTLGEEETRVGVVDFSGYGEILLVSSFNTSKQALINAIENMEDFQDGTATQDALNLTMQTFLNDGRDPAKGFPWVAILVTDGEPNEPTLAANAATALKDIGVTLFTIGVEDGDSGDINLGSLQSTASVPTCLHFYTIAGYSNLAANFPKVLAAQTCGVSASIPANVPEVNRTVGENQSRYFRRPTNVSHGLTLSLETGMGATAMYASLTNRLPSAANYDYKASSGQGQLGQIYITPEALEKMVTNNKTASYVRQLSDIPKDIAEEVVTVFISVAGEQKNNSFSLKFDEGDDLVTTKRPTTVRTTTTTKRTTTHMRTTVRTTPTACISSAANQTLGDGQSDYFCQPTNVTAGLTLTLDTTNGDTEMFASLTNPRPSATDYDYTASSGQGQVAQLYISPADLVKAAKGKIPAKDVAELVTVYISVSGYAKNNTFSLQVDPGDTKALPVQTSSKPTLPTSTHSSAAKVDCILLWILLALLSTYVR